MDARYTCIEDGAMLLLRATAKNTTVSLSAGSGCTPWWWQNWKNLFTPALYVDFVEVETERLMRSCSCAVRALLEIQGLELPFAVPVEQEKRTY